MPDNHVYVVYSKPYKTPTERVRHEYVVALLEEFSYDYKEGILIEHLRDIKKPLFLESFIDRYNQKMKIIKTVKKIKNIFNSDVLVESHLNKCIKPVPQEPVLCY
jgi:hypothetical protein